MGKHVTKRTNNLVSQGLRECNVCHQVKSLEDFHKSKSRPGGRRYECRPCSLVTNGQRYKSDEAFRERCKAKTLNRRRLCKEKCMSHYSEGIPTCKCCGETNIAFLTIDHVNNDGAEHRRRDPNARGGSLYYLLVRSNFPEGFQVLCMNCNCAKEWYGVCPHKGEVKHAE
jgi:hypothetical protein